MKTSKDLLAAVTKPGTHKRAALSLIASAIIGLGVMSAPAHARGLGGGNVPATDNEFGLDVPIEWLGHPVYVKFGVSQVDFDFNGQPFVDQAFITTTKDTGWFFEGGWQFDRFWAMELGYHNLGAYSFQYNTLGNPAAITEGRTTAQAWTLSALGRYEILRNYTHLTGQVEMGLGNTQLFSPLQDFSAIKPHLGVGLAHALGGDYSAVVHWRHHFNFAGSAGSLDDIQLGIKKVF